MIDPVAVDRELRGALLPLLAGTLGAGGILEAPVPVGELGRGLVAHSGGGLSGGPGFIEYSFLIYKPSSGPSANLASGPALVHGVCSLPTQLGELVEERFFNMELFGHVWR